VKIVVVLNDGDTYSDIVGCKIVGITDEGMEAVECGVLKVTDAAAVFEISLEAVVLA
jgi:hypothetical protein